MTKRIILCMFSINTADRAGKPVAYVYAHRVQKSPNKSMKIKPFTCLEVDDKKIDRDVSNFVKSYGVDDFTIIKTESPEVVMVHVRTGYPTKENDTLNLVVATTDKMKKLFEQDHHPVYCFRHAETVISKLDEMIEDAGVTA